MAIINGLYVHVTDESVTRDVEATSHPVEDGIPLTDTVRPSAISLSISGKIVAYGSMTASKVIVQLKQWQNSGNLIDYRGRNIQSSLQIRSFETSHTNTINGGADFSMELVQVRIAKSAYTPPKQTAPAAKPEETTTTTTTTVALKVGAKVVFKGGPVFKSSTAKKKAATRSRSTCKITIITGLSKAHPYHLISTDGKKVYGWVNTADIETTVTTTTNGTTNAGTQQVTNGSGTAVYHTVKNGDTVYDLVNNSYKNLGKSVQWVIDNNPDCFSTKGDATTLKVGSKLLMGYK